MVSGRVHILYNIRPSLKWNSEKKTIQQYTHMRVYSFLWHEWATNQRVFSNDENIRKIKCSSVHSLSVYIYDMYMYNMTYDRIFKTYFLFIVFINTII